MFALTINIKNAAFCLNSDLKDALTRELMTHYALGDAELDEIFSNLNDLYFYNKRTILMRAAEENHINLMHLLLEANADPFVKDKDGKTLFDYATLEVLRFLIQYFNEQFQVPDYFFNDVPMEDN